MLQKPSDTLPAGLDNRGESQFPRAPRQPRLMRKPWFDPPVTRDDSRPVLTYKRNEATFDFSTVEIYRDHVNKTTWNGFPERTVKMAAPAVVPMYSAMLVSSDNLDGLYFEVTYTFHINLETWDRRVLDAGYNQFNNTTLKKTRITLDDGNAPPVPVPLDGYGGKQTATDSSTGALVGVYRTFKVYPEAEFNDLSIV